MDESQLLLKERELVRLRVIETTLTGRSARDAAAMLRIWVRQVFRLKARVLTQGARGVIHGNTGRRPANAKPISLRQRVLKLLRTVFSNYNDYHCAEALEEEYQLKVNPETLRRWLRAAAIPPKRRHRSVSNHRRRRERRARFGELIFIVGSPHPWARAIAEARGASRHDVASPTFAILHEYPVPEGPPVIHIDGYRLSESQREWLEIGIDEILAAPGLKLIEWPKASFSQFETGHWDVRIDVRDDGARIVDLTRA